MTSELAIQKAIQQQALTKAAVSLLGICAGILADGHLHNREVLFLSNWLREHEEVADVWPGSEIARRVEAILADGIITEEERKELKEALEAISGNYFSDTGYAAPEGPVLPVDDDPSIFFRDMTFCFTGKFLYGTRAACERVILGLGGVAVDNITKDLNYLVIGTLIPHGPIRLTGERSKRQ